MKVFKPMHLGFICLFLVQFQVVGKGSILDNIRIENLSRQVSFAVGDHFFESMKMVFQSDRDVNSSTVFRALDHVSLRQSFSLISSETDSLVHHGETLLVGLLSGLIITFLVLSFYSNIKPYKFCSFWFIGLMLLYTWRSGYFYMLMPGLEGSAFKGIYFFVLQSFPVIIYLFTTKAVTVLQTKEYRLFQRIFGIFLSLALGYLGLVILMSILNVSLLVDYFGVIQGVFLVFLVLLGIPSLAWLVLSSRKSLNFYKFQASFGLLFISALIGKFLLSPSDFSSAFLKPNYLLIGIAIQLIYMFWLLLTSIFNNQSSEVKANALSPEPIELEANETSPSLAGLSPRELEILKAYCNGFSYSEISSSFLISPNTVKTHLKNCYRKLEINSKVEAIGIMNKSNS